MRRLRLSFNPRPNRTRNSLRVVSFAFENKLRLTFGWWLFTRFIALIPSHNRLLLVSGETCGCEFLPPQHCPLLRIHRNLMTHFPRSLSAVFGAPRDAVMRIWNALNGALRIRRLEGSRPDGRLCTLDGSDRVQMSVQVTEVGMMCGFEVAGRRRLVAWHGSADAVKVTLMALKVG